MNNKFSDLFGYLEGLDERSSKFLVKALERSNLDGFDYLEYKQSTNNLKGMMDEAMAIKSAFATAINIGLTKEKLVQTARHYKGVLDKEKNQFETALANRRKNHIAEKEKEVEQWKTAIAKNMEQIKKLQELNVLLQDKIDNHGDEIQKEMQLQQAREQSFLNAYQLISSEIESDIQKIQTLI